MFTHLLITANHYEDGQYAFTHKSITSIEVSHNRCRIKMHKGRLSSRELVFLMVEYLRLNYDKCQEALDWEPLHQERGTTFHTGFSGATDYFITFKDEETGFANRKKVLHETMSGFVEPNNGSMIEFFLPDFLLLCINNELPIGNRVVLDMIRKNLPSGVNDEGYDLVDCDDKKILNVRFQDIQNSYTVTPMRSLGQFIEDELTPREEPAEETVVEEAGEVVGE